MYLYYNHRDGHSYERSAIMSWIDKCTKGKNDDKKTMHSSASTKDGRMTPLLSLCSSLLVGMSCLRWSSSDISSNWQAYGT